jgi:ubiquinone/menaquinone biosynthesis C-methylase UbiE
MTPPVLYKRTWTQTLRESLTLLKLMVFGRGKSSESLYNFLSTHNSLAENSQYINLGFWRDETHFDRACEAMAEQVGLAAELDESSRVLDCGNGHGDQDAYFLNRFSPESIVGLNITQKHVEIAQKRYNDSRLRFLHGSATEMPFDKGAFNRVIALESAFHFDSREDFFAEAFRVLEPNGRLACADLIRKTNDLNFSMRLTERMGRAFWQIPKANLCTPEHYRAQLAAAGFVDIQIEDISDQVFRGFKDFAKARLQDPEVRRRVHPWLRSAWGKENEGKHNFIYVMIRARKPVQ